MNKTLLLSILFLSIIIVGCSRQDPPACNVTTPINISENISRAFNSGMVSAVGQIIDNTKECQIAVLEVNKGNISSKRELIDITCIETKEAN